MLFMNMWYITLFGKKWGLVNIALISGEDGYRYAPFHWIELLSVGDSALNKWVRIVIIILLFRDSNENYLRFQRHSTNKILPCRKTHYTYLDSFIFIYICKTYAYETAIIAKATNANKNAFILIKVRYSLNHEKNTTLQYLSRLTTTVSINRIVGRHNLTDS